MRSMLFLLSAATLAVSTITAPSASAEVNLISNGDFESGSTGASAPGWVIDSAPAPDSILVLNGSAYIPCCGANGSAASLANQFVSFGAGDTRNNPARILQNFTSTRATPSRYRVTFDYAAIGVATHRLSFGVFDYGSNTFRLIDTVTAGASNNLDTMFSRYSSTFLLRDGNGSIQFTSFDRTTSKDAFLDNVRIAAVPEPATWAMMIFGFGMVGGAMRRRQKVRFAYA